MSMEDRIWEKKVSRLEWKNDGVMDDKSGDGDADEVRWSWKYGESGGDRSRRGAYASNK